MDGHHCTIDFNESKALDHHLNMNGEGSHPDFILTARITGPFMFLLQRQTSEWTVLIVVGFREYVPIRLMHFRFLQDIRREVYLLFG